MITTDKTIAFNLTTRIDYQQGVIVLSSYLKGFPEEQQLRTNQTGTLFLELIDGVRTIDDILKVVSPQLGISKEDIQEDIFDFYKNLIDLNFLVIT